MTPSALRCTFRRLADTFFDTSLEAHPDSMTPNPERIQGNSQPTSQLFPNLDLDASRFSIVPQNQFTIFCCQPLQTSVKTVLAALLFTFLEWLLVTNICGLLQVSLSMIKFFLDFQENQKTCPLHIV